MILTLDPDGTEFNFVFGWDEAIKDDLKESLPGRRWEGNSTWSVPITPTSIPLVMAFADKWGFKVTPQAQGKADNLEIIVETRHALSKSIDGKLEIAGMTGDLMGHQKSGVAYSRQTISKGRGIIIADEPGLGKTALALAITQDQKSWPLLVVCPAKLKLNWRAEINRWLPDKSVLVVSAGKKSKKEFDESLITPADYIALCPQSDVLVVNYDLVRDVKENPQSTSNFDKYFIPEGTLTWAITNGFNPSTVVFDEGHVLSNYKSAQTRTCKKIAARRKVRLLLTGTPVVNKPQDLLSQLTVIGQLESLGGFNFFREHYCGVDGNMFSSPEPKNLTELNSRLIETCYIRRTKVEVLKDLPEKMYAEVVFPNDNKKGYSSQLSNVQEGAQSSMAQGMTEIDSLKEQAALGKMEGVVEWAEKNFIDSGTKLVIFAWHKSIQRELFSRLSELTSCARLSADDSDVEVEAFKKKFNDDPNCLIMVASMKMGSVGHTLHAHGLATNVAFMEFGWNPKDHIQSEDRCIAGGQLVQSSNGFIEIEKIKIGDTVLTSNGKWNKVTNIGKRKHNGLMTRIDYMRYSESLICTDDHKILIARKQGDKPEWTEAKNVRAGDFVVCPRIKGKTLREIVIPDEVRIDSTFVHRGRNKDEFRPSAGWTQPNSRLVHLPKSIKITDDVLYLFGWYLAEGFSSILEGKGKFISLSGNNYSKKASIDRLKIIIETVFGVNCSIYKTKNSRGIELRAYSFELANLFIYLFGTGNAIKKLPEILLNMSDQQSCHLLAGYVDGDGYKRKNQVEWSSRSASLAVDMARLAATCGYSPTIRKVSNSTCNNGLWIGGYSSSINDHEAFTYNKVRGVETYFNTTDVYDLSIENNQSFVVGLATVHNCHRIGQTGQVTVWALIADGTIDRDILQLINKKRIVVDQITDGKIPAGQVPELSIYRELMQRLGQEEQ